MKGVKHFKRDGTLHTGSSHKMPNGDLHGKGTYGKKRGRPPAKKKKSKKK